MFILTALMGQSAKVDKQFCYFASTQPTTSTLWLFFKKYSTLNREKNKKKKKQQPQTKAIIIVLISANKKAFEIYTQRVEKKTTRKCQSKTTFWPLLTVHSYTPWAQCIRAFFSNSFINVYILRRKYLNPKYNELKQRMWKF